VEMKSLFLKEWDAYIRYHELTGQGKTLIFLPGLCIPAVEQFLSVVTHTNMAEYHALLIDYLGSGCSEYSDRFDYSIENHARSISAVLDIEGVNDCTIIGHSMGGTVGIMLAIIRPELVSNLIIAEANITPGGGKTTRCVASYPESDFILVVYEEFLQELIKAEISGDAVAAIVNAAWSKTDPLAIYKNSLSLVKLDPTFKQQFLNLLIPRTFIYGAETFPDRQDEVQPDVPDPNELKRFGVQIAIVSNAGHAMMFDNLNGFVNVLNQAIQSSNIGRC